MCAHKHRSGSRLMRETDRQTDQLDRVCTTLPIVTIITIQATEFIGLGQNYFHKASSADGMLSCGEDPSFYFSVAFSVVPNSACLELTPSLP